MMLVPAGPFLFGPDNLTEVIEYNFYIDKYPVTNLDFLQFLEDINITSKMPPGFHDYLNYLRMISEKKPDHPVVNINRYVASQYCEWAGKRLPTSKEWEKAARGIDGRLYPWGDTFQIDKCNCLESGYNEG